MIRFFTGNIGEVRALKEKIEESERLIFLSKIPVILMLMCLLWEDEKRLADTQTELYQEFVLFLWRKYCKRWCKTVDFRNIIDGEFEQFISEIGQVALDGLCSEKNIKEEKLIFNDTDFGNSFQLGCETGLLSRERLRSRLSRHSTVTFLHKSFQEFCAAKYWASLYTTDTAQFSQILSRLKPWAVLMGNFEFAKFCCGLVERGGVSSIIQHAISVYRRHSHPKDICVGYNKPDDGKKNVVNILTLLYENDKAPSDCNSNVDTFNPQSSVSQQCQDKSISRTECSLDPPGTDCVIAKRHKSDVLKSSLTQSFKSIFPDYGFTIAVANKYPKAISIFHNFVRSKLGLSILSTVKSISFENPHLSENVIGDTLKCMSNVQDVTFKFSEVDHNVKSELANSIQPSIKSICFVNPHLCSCYVASIIRCMSNVHDVSVTISVFDHVDQIGVILTDKQCLTKLNSLKLTLAQMKADHMKILSEYLSKVSNLQELNVSNNDLGMAIRPLAQQLQYCTKLTSLNLYNTQLKENHIKILSEYLSKVSNLQELNVSNNDLGIAIRPLAQLLQYCTKLTSLKLSKTQLKENHIKILSEYLPKVSNLQELNVSKNDLGMAIRPLAQQLQYCTKLTSLNLSNTQLKEDHIEILSEFLPKVSNLKELALSENNLGMSIGALAQQLQHCPLLSKLHLCNTNIPDEGVVELSQKFISLPNLTHLSLFHAICSYFGNYTVDALFKHIHHLTKLQYLSFECWPDSKCSDRVKDCLAAIGKSTGSNRIIMHHEDVKLVQNAARKYL
ncbi:NLR family CARD domain-containing protein 4-like [Amphiura filiformis]|uniref:NLR family CARD domain-containing protein 4-like n=1 Tax=Amphiura filiformis TaxID=82378 RepID=UPI003B211FD3